MAFDPPSEQARLNAIGPTDELSPPLRRAFDPANDFDPIPRPNDGDWLAVHPEEGQTFDQYRRSKPNKPVPPRAVICLLPLGEFPKDQSPPLDRLAEYAAAFFAMEVKVLPNATVGDGVTMRINSSTRKRQLLTTDLLAVLRRKLPADAFCLLGITMEDLYPDASWNFVFGQASLRERVGVYSFVRYDPAFHGETRDASYQSILLRRSCKVLVHETAHMFGLHHCIHFRCVMNGSNNLPESDSRPMHLCPVCLRKLQWSAGFDVVGRYRKLAEFYGRTGLDDEARWTTERLQHIEQR